jgi:MFS family permease
MRLPEVSRNTKLLGIASFFTDVSSEMIFPLLPFFLIKLLSSPDPSSAIAAGLVIAPAIVIGLMEGFGEFVVSITGFISGFYSDRIGKRKKIILFGYSISAFFKGFLLILSSWQQMIILRMLERIGKGVRDVPRDALIGLSESKSNLGNAFGFRKMLDNTGALLGPLLASFILIFLSKGEAQTIEIYKTVFAIAIVPAVFAVLSLFFLDDHYTERTKPKVMLKEVFHTKNFKQFLIAGSVFSLGQFTMMFFLLRSSDFMPLFLVPIAYLAFNVFYTIFSMPAGIMADKLGAKKTLLFGMFCFLVALVGFTFFPSQNMIFGMFLFLGLFMAIAETAPQIFLIRNVDQTKYASAIGSYKGVLGIVALPANIIAGVLYAFPVSGAQFPVLGFLFPAAGSPATFVFSIATTIIGMVLLAALVRE